jgi:archaemetzincin
MIMLIPIGEVEKSALENLRRPLAKAFDQRTRVEGGIRLNQASREQRRSQYLSSALLAELPSPPGLGDRVLGVVDEDIFAQGLNFVFGEADIARKKALISLKRLRPEFYRIPKNEDLFRERTVKEAVHELGHTYGLKHCPHPTCVMHFSNSLRDTDFKGWNFCPACKARLIQ